MNTSGGGLDLPPSSHLQDIQVVAELRQAGVPLNTILSSKLRGRGGLIRKIESQQKKESKQLRKLEKQERKQQRRSGKMESDAPLPTHLAGKPATTGPIRTLAVEA